MTLIADDFSTTVDDIIGSIEQSELPVGDSSAAVSSKTTWLLKGFSTVASSAACVMRAALDAEPAAQHNITPAVSTAVSKADTPS